MEAQALTSAIVGIEYSGHLFAALLYVIAGLLLNSKNGTQGVYRPLQLACYVTGATQILLAAAQGIHIPSITIHLVKVGNLGVWAVALWRLLESSTGKKLNDSIKIAFGIIWAVSAAIMVGNQSLFARFNISYNFEWQLLIGPIIMTLAILALIEQLIRNSTPQHRHNIKYICIGLIVLMGCELYSLTFQTLFEQPDPYIANAIGTINVLVALLFLFGSLRTQPEQSIAISRNMAYYSSALLIAGLFLLLMAIAAYYTQLQNAAWSAALQLVLVSFTFISLTVAAASRSIRANIQVFVNKHFFRHKYDYRNVWLNLIKTLSDMSEQDDFYTGSIKAVADIFNSEGGSLWLNNENEQFEQVTRWNIDMPDNLMVGASSPFISPFLDQEWVYALGESGNNLIDPYGKLLPDWVHNIKNAWVIVPLMIGSNLRGFFLLTHRSNSSTLNWEDLDVLKSVGRQLASYIVRQKSAEQLAEAKQFDTYNKLTAFIMHDLKNLIAQQALVVQNANKHKENPAFVEDAIQTIDNSVARMSNLLKRLQSSGQAAPQRSIAVQKLILEAIRKSTDRQPIPTLRTKSIEASVTADQEQLVMILMHVIRNAQDATDSSGFIDVSLLLDNNQVIIEIEDNGCGMDEDFLRKRLFKPFESTKSSMGMGIGAYQVREFIQNMGGQIKVTSELNIGTNVCIMLPISNSSTETAGEIATEFETTTVNL